MAHTGFRINEVVLYYLILVLESFMLAVLLWKLLLLARGGRWRRFGCAICHGLESCWRNVSRKEDPRVLQRHHAALCGLVISGSKTFLLALVCRLLAIQNELRLGKPHGYNPALDPSNILCCLICFLTLLGQDYFPHWMLDPWYLIMEFTCLLPVFLCDHDSAEVQQTTYLTLLPRFIIGLCAQRDWLPFVVQSLGCCAAMFLAEDANSYRFISGQAVIWLMLVSGVHALRAQTLKNVRISLNLEVRTVELEAVSELLLGFCDAVVEINSHLELTEDSRQLSTLLLKGYGMTDSLAGRKVLDLFCPEDRAHVESSLMRGLNMGTTPIMALNARMLDSLGNLVRVELLHASFRSGSHGGRRCLVGMREFQDAVEPLPDDVSSADSLCLSIKDKASEHVNYDTSDLSIMFDAASFDILSVSEAFNRLGSRFLQQDAGFEGCSLMDLSLSCMDPRSFSCMMQDAVNRFDEANGQEVEVLRKCELLGMETDVAVSIQQDPILDTLIGTAVIFNLVEKASTTPWAQQQIRMRQDSRSSKSSRGSKRHLQHPRQCLGSGSILELRGTYSL